MDQGCCRDNGEPSVLIGPAPPRLKDTIIRTVSHIHQRVIQSFMLLSVEFLLFWIATFLYGGLYYSYMPVTAFSLPVHYYHRTECESPTSFFCSYPVANISLMKNNKHMLTPGQTYRIALQLEMPDSPVNRVLGMFMIKTTCFSGDGSQVATSTSSASEPLSASSFRFMMPRYRSDMLRYFEMLLFLPAFLSGAAEQKQVLEVELFTDYTDSPYGPLTSAFIEILSNKVQIYSSQLYIHAHFTGIRYFMFNFPLLSALVGISSNLIFLSFLLGLRYLRLLLPVNSAQQEVTLKTNRRLSDRENTNNTHEEDEKDAAADT